MASLAVDRASTVEWYKRNRTRTRRIFDLIDPSAYYSRPIALRNPIVFYEGHLPAFSVISFLQRGLGRPPVDATFEKLFERGIDPDSTDAAVPRSGANTVWPSLTKHPTEARRSAPCPSTTIGIPGPYRFFGQCQSGISCWSSVDPGSTFTTHTGTIRPSGM
jgi:hypothetical protein